MMQKTEKWLKTCTWVLIWEYWARAIQWIPTWQGLDSFQWYLRPCALDKNSLRIGRVTPSFTHAGTYEISLFTPIFECITPFLLPLFPLHYLILHFLWLIDYIEFVQSCPAFLCNCPPTLNWVEIAHKSWGQGRYLSLSIKVGGRAGTLVCPLKLGAGRVP